MAARRPALLGFVSANGGAFPPSSARGQLSIHKDLTWSACLGRIKAWDPLIRGPRIARLSGRSANPKKSGKHSKARRRTIFTAIAIPAVSRPGEDALYRMKPPRQSGLRRIRLSRQCACPENVAARGRTDLRARQVPLAPELKSLAAADARSVRDRRDSLQVGGYGCPVFGRQPGEVLDHVGHLAASRIEVRSEAGFEVLCDFVLAP